MGASWELNEYITYLTLSFKPESQRPLVTWHALDDDVKEVTINMRHGACLDKKHLKAEDLERSRRKAS